MRSGFYDTTSKDGGERNCRTGSRGIGWNGCFGIVAALAAASYRRVSKHMRHARRQDKALDDGMRALLRDRIISACDHYFEKGYAPVYARENITSMYEAYTAWAGTGS